MTISDGDMSLQTPWPMRAVTAFTTRQHAVTKNANPITARLRRSSPRFSQYVPDDSSPAATDALARFSSCRSDQESCTSNTNEHSVNSCTALRLEIASAESAFVASLTLEATPVMCRIGVEGLTSGCSMTHPGGTAVSGSELSRVSAACSIAAAVSGARSSANSAPSSRHSLLSASHRQIAYLYSLSSVPKTQPRDPTLAGSSPSRVDATLMVELRLSPRLCRDAEDTALANCPERRFALSRVPVAITGDFGRASSTSPRGIVRTRRVTYTTLMMSSVSSSEVSFLAGC